MKDNLFQAVQINRPKSNKFDLSHERKLTLNMGKLYPVMCQEVVPGDKFRVDTQVFLRFLSLIAPVMHRIDVTVQHFFVPNRLLWDGWETFITGGREGTDTSVMPNFQMLNLHSAGSVFLKDGNLLDHLGFPTNASGTLDASYEGSTFSALPVRAYQLIWDTYYRDQNVTGTIIDASGDVFRAEGSLSTYQLNQYFGLQSVAWEKDYLTSALPWAQRGNPVDINVAANQDYKRPSQIRRADTDALIASASGMTTDTSGNLNITVGASHIPGYVDNIEDINSMSFTINALRTSIKIQEWLERNALGGARYIEQILSHFGVVSSDARLQRPEYLGGGRAPVIISEVLTTAPPTSVSDLPPATMAGHGISVGGSAFFSRFFEEHGIVMSLMFVRPKTNYQTTLPRMWTRFSNMDYLFPSFAHLGEQPVHNYEVSFDSGYVNGEEGFNTFGYQSRYAEYKYVNSTVHGQMRSSLAYWHLARILPYNAALNTSFITCSPRSDIFAVEDDVDHLVAHVMNNVSALRPLPYFGTPSF